MPRMRTTIHKDVPYAKVTISYDDPKTGERIARTFTCHNEDAPVHEIMTWTSPPEDLQDALRQRYKEWIEQ